MNPLTADDIKALGGLFTRNVPELEGDENKAILEIIQRENKTNDRYLDVSKYSKDLQQRLLLLMLMVPMQGLCARQILMVL